MARTNRQDLPRVSDRIATLYFEHVKVGVANGAVTAADRDGTRVIPSAQLACLQLGPGTSITQKAVTVLADHGVSVVWTGSGAVRAYSTITPLARSSHVIERQAQLWANETRRLQVARDMYAARFPGQDVSKMQGRDLRAAEGRRVRTIYREAADQRGLPWSGRVHDWSRADDTNRALTAAYRALYGAALAVIQALGASPALGFVHTGTVNAFVYDLADLHKTDLGVRVAFDTAGEDDGQPIDRAVRAAMNQAMKSERTLERMVDAVLEVFGLATAAAQLLDADDLDLVGGVPANMNYADSVTSPDWGF